MRVKLSIIYSGFKLYSKHTLHRTMNSLLPHVTEMFSLKSIILKVTVDKDKIEVTQEHQNRIKLRIISVHLGFVSPPL